MVRILMFIYLLIGIMFATFAYYLLMNDDNVYKDRELLSKKSSIIFIVFICTCFWIILIPIIIYENSKEGKNNG